MRLPLENLPFEASSVRQRMSAVNTGCQSRNIIRIWIILLAIAAVFLSCPHAVRGTERSRQEIGVRERLEAEQRLWDLGYWAGPIDGKFDSASRHALLAFQKVERRRRTGILTWEELKALENARRPLARHAGVGHVEIDLTRQVLFVIDESGIVSRILPVSTGNGERYVDHGEVHRARTPIGTFKVLRKINGWRLSSLGLLYYPSYILNGIAIHGSLSIPTYAASHGCIRIPMFAAKELSGMLPVGTEVIVFRSDGGTAS
jgi:L,D-transpeptidase catalytic domain/Putative peptidoglycan binding domain